MTGPLNLEINRAIIASTTCQSENSEPLTPNPSPQGEREESKYLLKVADRLVIGLAAQCLIRLGMVNALIQEMHRSIDEQELCSSGMH